MKAVDVIAELAAQARAAVRAQPRRLVALVVGIPRDMEALATQAELRDALVRAGFTDVDVLAEVRPGAPRIVRLEYA